MKTKEMLYGLRKIFAVTLSLVIALAPLVYAADAFQFRRPSDGVSLGEIDTNGNVIFRSSFTASAFFGDGANLTGVSATPTGSAGGDLTGTYPNPTIANDAVTTAKILNLNVTSAKLAADSVVTSKILDANVTAAKMVNSGVFTGDATTTFPNITIGANAITSGKIATGAVGPTQLADTAVTPGSYGSATQVGTFTVDADGRLTAASNVTATPAAASVQAGSFSGSFTFSSALTVSGLDMRGALSAASLQSTACSAHATVPCMAYNTNDSDLYTSTGTGVGAWRNTRTGTAP